MTHTKAIIVGPDRGLASALEDHGIDTVRIDVGTGASLDEAGVADADLLVLTDVGEATSVPVAKDRNPDLRVIAYSPDTIPEFVRGQVDFAVAPDVLDPEIVAEELAGAEARGAKRDGTP